MRKYTFTAIALLLSATLCDAFVAQGLSCQANPNGAAPTSFILLRKQPGESSFTGIVEQATCAFPDQTIPDSGETCFQFAAKNASGIATRSWTTICVDPRLVPTQP